MNNAEYLLKQGIKFNDLGFYPTDTIHTFCIKNNKTHDILGTIKANTTFTALQKFPKWLDEEHVEDILTVDENAYLSAVIKPFRNKIKAIGKDYGWSSKEQRIYFYATDETFCLKSFKTGTMYKGMETHKKYSLEELGL